MHTWVELHVENNPKAAAKWLEENRSALSQSFDKLCITNGKPPVHQKAAKSPDTQENGTMTKQKIAKMLETLVEEIVLANGGAVHDCMILCGGKQQASRVAVGGKFDLNAARGILAHAIVTNAALLTGGQGGSPSQPSSQIRVTGGPVLGPDGRVHLPA